MIDPISSVLAVQGISPSGVTPPPAVQAAEAGLPVREADSAAFSPEALEMLRAIQAEEEEGG